MIEIPIRHADDMRSPLRIAKSPAHRGFGLTQLMHEPPGRGVLEFCNQNASTCDCDFVAGVFDLPRDRRVFLDLSSFHKERGSDVMSRQQLKNFRRNRPGPSSKVSAMTLSVVWPK